MDRVTYKTFLRTKNQSLSWHHQRVLDHERKRVMTHGLAYGDETTMWTTTDD